MPPCIFFIMVSSKGFMLSVTTVVNLSSRCIIFSIMSWHYYISEGKLVYLPLLAIYNISFLQHLLFSLTPVCVSVKILDTFSPSFGVKQCKTKTLWERFVLIFIRSNVDKAGVDDSWEQCSCVLRQWFKKF